MPTEIEWTHWPGFRGETLNPIVGCSKTSEGCKHCYAVRNAHRLAGNPNRAVQAAYRGLTHTTADGGLEWTGTVRFRPEELAKVARWRKPRCIFWCSMSDLFHPSVEGLWLGEILRTMIEHPEHRHIVLTKRPYRMFHRVDNFIGGHFEGQTMAEREAAWLAATQHIIWGITVENQARLNERWYWLGRRVFAHKFVSLEPLLEPVLLEGPLFGAPDAGGGCQRCPYVWEWDKMHKCPPGTGPALDWVIVGGETGPVARHMNPAWAFKIWDDCRKAGVPFFFKQMSGREPIPDDLMIREFPAIAHGTHGKDGEHGDA